MKSINYPYTLSVGINKAENLPVADFIQSDPYVYYHLGEEQKQIIGRTKTIYRNKDLPIWNETFVTHLMNKSQFLYFHIFDTDKGKDDDLLGIVQIDLSDIPINSPILNKKYPISLALPFQNSGLKPFLTLSISLFSNSLVSLTLIDDMAMIVSSDEKLKIESLKQFIDSSLLQTERILSSISLFDQNQKRVEYLLLHLYAVLKDITSQNHPQIVLRKALEYLLNQTFIDILHYLSTSIELYEKNITSSKSKDIDDISSQFFQFLQFLDNIENQLFQHFITFVKETSSKLVFHSSSSSSSSNFGDFLVEAFSLKKYVSVESLLSKLLSKQFYFKKELIFSEFQQKFIKSFTKQHAGHLKEYSFPEDLVTNHLGPLSSFLNSSSSLTTAAAEKNRSNFSFFFLQHHSMNYYSLLNYLSECYATYLETVQSLLVNNNNNNNKNDKEKKGSHSEISHLKDSMLIAIMNDCQDMQRKGFFMISSSSSSSSVPSSPTSSDVDNQSIEVMKKHEKNIILEIIYNFKKIERNAMNCLSSLILEQCFLQHKSFYSLISFEEVYNYYSIQLNSLSSTPTSPVGSLGVSSLSVPHSAVLSATSPISTSATTTAEERKKTKYFLSESVFKQEILENMKRLIHWKLLFRYPSSSYSLLQLCMIKKFMILYYFIIFSFSSHLQNEKREGAGLEEKEKNNSNNSNDAKKRNEELLSYLHEDGRRLLDLFYSLLPSPSSSSSSSSSTTAGKEKDDDEEENQDYSSWGEAIIDIFSHYLRLLSKDNQLTLQSMNCLLNLKGETTANNTNSVKDEYDKNEKKIEIIKQSLEVFLSFHEDISRTIQRRSSKFSMTTTTESTSTATADKKKKKDSFVFSFFRSNSDRFRKERENNKNDMNSNIENEEEKNDIIEIVNQLNKFVLSSSSSSEVLEDAGKSDSSVSDNSTTTTTTTTAVLTRRKSSHEEIMFINQFYSFFEEILFVFQYSSSSSSSSSSNKDNVDTQGKQSFKKLTLRDLMNNNNKENNNDGNNIVSFNGMNNGNNAITFPKKASLFFSSFHCNYLLYLQNSLSFKYEQPIPCLRIKVISNADNAFQQKVLLEKDTQLFTATVAADEIKTNKTVTFPDIIELDLLEIFQGDLSSVCHLYQFLSIRIELRYYRSNYESVCVGFIQLPFLLSFTSFNSSSSDSQSEDKKPQYQQQYHIFHFNENDNMVKTAVDHAISEQRPLTHISFSLSNEFGF
jgi:hypothetical protein